MNLINMNLNIFKYKPLSLYGPGTSTRTRQNLQINHNAAHIFQVEFWICDACNQLHLDILGIKASVKLETWKWKLEEGNFG